MSNTPTLISPTADWSFSYSRQVVNGQAVLVRDLDLTYNGDAAQQVGAKRLAQDIADYLLIPVGADPFDPTKGNPYYQLIGRADTLSDTPFVQMIEAAEAWFLQKQQTAILQGYLSLDEQLQSLTEPAPAVTRPQSGAISVAFTITTRAGTTLSVSVPLV